MKDYRDANFSAADSDPFADLVRAVEGSSVRPGTRQDRSQSGGYEPVLGPAERVTATAQHGRSGRPVNPETQEALRNLSQPARPRDRYPAETQSFAPAREIEPEPYAPVRQTMPDARQTLTLDDFDDLIASEWAAMQPASQPYDDEDYGSGYEDDDRAYDDHHHRPEPRRGFKLGKALVVFGGIAATAVVAVAGTMHYAGTGALSSGAGGPILIKADAEPYKVAPADPGGRSIPNQKQAVYEHVAAGSVKMDAPTQRKLVTAMEEPMDISENEESSSTDLPGVMVGENVALPSETDAEADAPPAPGAQVASAEGTLQPRKVRTLTVRPDGTLAPAEEPTIAGQPALLPTSSPVAAHPVVAQPTMPTMQPATPAAAAEADPVQVASVQPAAPAEDAFFVQISSQPSQALAEESMANLSRRYASVIGSRSLGIKSAEIAGKGTYYRVRVAAGSRNEAASLCDSLKSAGGSCFVTR